MSLRSLIKAGRLTPRARTWLGISLIIGVIGLVSIPAPNVMVAASLQTETIETMVHNPGEAQFYLPKAIVFDETGNEVCLEDIHVLPRKGAALYFTKTLGGDVFIAIEGGVDWRSQAGFNQSDMGSEFALPGSGNCFSDTLIRLPIAGTIKVGTVASGGQSDEGPPALLIEGELDVYGRAIDRVFGIGVERFPFLPMEPNRLYLANTLSVPGGSELSSQDARWWGFMDVIPGKAVQGMHVEASTNARLLELKAPAPRLAFDEGEAGPLRGDTISLTFGAQLGNDPNIRWLFGAISFLLFVFGIFFQIPVRPGK